MYKNKNEFSSEAQTVLSYYWLHFIVIFTLWRHKLQRKTMLFIITIYAINFLIYA